MTTAIKDHPSKVTLLLTGAQTNSDFCLRMLPEVKENIEKLVGGAIGLGNTGVAAEYNIQIDPEVGGIVFHSGIQLVMVPLEVTHKVLLVTSAILTKFSNIDNLELYLPISELDSCSTFHLTGEELPHCLVEYQEVFQTVERHQRMQGGDGSDANTPNNEDGGGSSNEDELDFTSKFAECYYKMLTFFQGTYCREFGFTSPPLHGPGTICYLTHPECFRTVHLYVDVETEGEKCAERTLCDMNDLLKKPKNVFVWTDIEADKFLEIMLHYVKKAARKSPMT